MIATGESRPHRRTAMAKRPTTASDAAAMILAGASALEVGTAFFRDLDAGKDISGGLEKYVSRYSCSRLVDIKGLARKQKA